MSSALDFGAQLALVQRSFRPLAREAKGHHLPRAMRKTGAARRCAPRRQVGLNDELSPDAKRLDQWPELMPTARALAEVEKFLPG